MFVSFGGTQVDCGECAAFQAEATRITAVAWASNAQDCSSAVSSPQHAETGAAGTVTDQLLLSTSCGCLLQLTVAITQSPAGSSLGKGNKAICQFVLFVLQAT
jgi:hypothetical protein